MLVPGLFGRDIRSIIVYTSVNFMSRNKQTRHFYIRYLLNTDSDTIILFSTLRVEQNNLYMSAKPRQSETRRFSLYPSNRLPSNVHIAEKTPLKIHNPSLFAANNAASIQSKYIKTLFRDIKRKHTHAGYIRREGKNIKLQGVTTSRLFLAEIYTTHKTILQQ